MSASSDGDGRPDPGEPREASATGAVRARRYSFLRTDRLRKRVEFLRVQDKGRRLAQPIATVLALPNGTGQTRLGVTVSKKVGNSPVRNHIKRRIREAFRLSRPLLPGGYDVVVVARSLARRASMRDFAALLAQWGQQVDAHRKSRGAPRNPGASP